MIQPFQKSLLVSYKHKPTLTIQSNNRAPWYLSKQVENTCPSKSLYTMFRAALFITAKLEASIHQQVDG